jgi:hypothetical protein
MAPDSTKDHFFDGPLFDESWHFADVSGRARGLVRGYRCRLGQRSA